MNNKKQKFTQLQRGQALVEYALIAILVGGAFVVGLLATGPVLGNIFQSAVVATVGEEDQRDTPELGITSFWQTVTWVAGNPRQETPFPTNDANPLPTEVPLGFETAVPDTPIPTDEPLPSPTDEPSATPEDLQFDLLYNDVADETEWYRLASDVFIGQNAWTGLFWQDETDTDTFAPFSNPSNVQLVRNYDANWSDFLNPLTDLPRITESRDFSARYSRPIFVYPNGAGTERLGFTVSNPGGGYRLYYQSTSGICANYRPAATNRNQTSGNSPCLIIDQWVNSPSDSVTAFKDFATGPDADNPAEYTLVMEYYQIDGSPNLQLDLFTPRVNPDDVGLAGDVVDCRWAQNEGDRTNTRTFSWGYSIGSEDVPNNSRCFLELRGSVLLENTDGDPAGFTQVTDPPVLSFWHVWDIAPEVDVYLEVSSYDPTYDEDGSLPGLQNFRNQYSWTKIWGSNFNGTPNLSGTENYEWTKEVVPLTGFNIGDQITYRFVIESSGISSDRKRWYVDDVQIGNENLPDLSIQNPLPEDTFGICQTDRTTCDSYWDLNDMAQAEDFRTTGRWALTANSGAVDGMAWEDDPGYSYSLESDGTRIYYIEFDKRVDVSGTTDDGIVFTDTTPDADGDTGPPLLSFWQTYSLKDDARLEIQYYDDTTDTWELLRTIVSTGPTDSASRPDKHYFEVPLNVRQTDTGLEEGYAEGWTAWANGPIRMRFAMIVEQGATTAPDAVGWTIDNIGIERLGKVDFTPYPLYDSAGDGDGNTIAESRNTWTRTGLWDITSGDAFETDPGDSETDQYSYMDSPNGDYIAGAATELVLRAPIDLRSDTPSNPDSQACDDTLPSVGTGNCSLTPQDPASNPTLTFWWKRDLATDHNFRVVMRTNGGAGTEIVVWEYIYDADDAEQNAWERVEVALAPFIPATGSTNDDDVIIAFQLDAQIGSGTADGVTIDEIRIEDNDDNPVFVLAPGTNGGNGQQYFDNVDGRTIVPGEVGGGVTLSDTDYLRWWERFYLGGTWFGSQSS